MCLTADDDVMGAVIDEGLMASMRPGAILVVHSTVAPSTCQRLAEVADRYAVEVLDAPVSGGRPEAYRRDLTLMVGGNREAFEACRPVFDSYASRSLHLGPLGSGR